MNIKSSTSSSVLFLLLNKFPTTGTLLAPGVLLFSLFIVFFLIPPMTTISPSLTNSLVKISLVLIPGSSEPGTSTAESLFTLISNKTLPSPIILGVTVNAKAASLNSVVVVPSAVVWYAIWVPWVILASWLLSVKILGWERVLLKAKDSNA